MIAKQELYELALMGLRVRAAELDARIELLRRQIESPGIRPTLIELRDAILSEPDLDDSMRVRKSNSRSLSPDARRRISEAQKRRWRKYHREHSR